MSVFARLDAKLRGGYDMYLESLVLVQTSLPKHACGVAHHKYAFCSACGQRPIAISVHFDGGHKDGRGSSAWTMSCAVDNSYQ